jgi:predicted nucleic-acid-binding protein
MIGNDTNVLVLYLIQDDPEQAVLATRYWGRLSERQVILCSTINPHLLLGARHVGRSANSL